MTVNVGDTVRWIWADNLFHSVESGTTGTFDGLFRSGSPTTFATFQQTFKFAGVFMYHCGVHVEMTGVVTVVFSGASPPVGPAQPTTTTPAPTPNVQTRNEASSLLNVSSTVGIVIGLSHGFYFYAI